MSHGSSLLIILLISILKVAHNPFSIPSVYVAGYDS